MVDHRRQRRRLAVAGRAHHQDQAAPQHHEVFQLLGHAEFVERGHLRRDVTQHHRDIAALVEHVHPEPAEARLRDREVDLELTSERVEQVFVHQLDRRLFDHLGRHLELVHRHDLAVDLDLGRRERRKEQVGGLLLDHQFE